jgi:hypothetical protein
LRAAISRATPRKNCHVQVVPAGVHHANRLALRVGGANRGCIIEARFFFDRKRIEFGARKQAWTGSILENGYDTECLRAVGIFADMFGNGVAEIS